MTVFRCKEFVLCFAEYWKEIEFENLKKLLIFLAP